LLKTKWVVFNNKVFLTQKLVSTVQLKSLEIKGFKSFADKTVLNFDQGVTGVIGPNGCGKSNIVDSIRWVIGEQKISHLRSENLDALVFNGSKSRSASGLAEVSLTFENTKNLLPTEFNTITITRKFYRNGESEYRLNDVSCRLKDIQNLLMDTGVSTDSYAIIELGMVDEIIKDKENSRRRMLEQAAGISIYKTRKKEAKNKLEATETDLNRIEDLIFEINNQLKTLENQAKKAEKYFEIKKEYREVSLELAKAALETFNLNYKDLTQKLDDHTNNKVALEAAIATDEAALESEKLGFVEKEKALQSLQILFNEIVQQVRTKENEKNLAQQSIHYLKEKQTGLQDFIAKADTQEKALNESIAFTTQQLTDENATLKNLETQLETLQNEVEEKTVVLNNHRTDVDNFRAENTQLQRDQYEAEKNVAVADTSIQNINRTITQLTDENASRNVQLKQLAEEKEIKTQELETKKVDLKQLQEQHEFTKEQIFSTQAMLEGLRNELADENRKLDAKKNEYDLLKSMIDSMEGYPDSVKFLHKNDNWNHHSPILSDILYVKEEYRAALENVLDPYLNYYIVNNVEEGLQAVHLLDENKKGKANFFLLNKFNQMNTLAKGRDAEHPDLMPAKDVVEYDSKYESLVNHLLGSVFIADNEEAIQNSNGHVVLEKTGKYVKGTYTLTGGSVGLFEGKKIGRIKNFEKLTEEITTQSLVVNDLKAVIQARHNEVISFNEQLKENAIKQTEQDINTLTNTVFSIENKIENLTHSQEQSNTRLTQLNFDLVTNQESIVSVKDLLGNLVNLALQATEKLQIANNNFNDAQEEFNVANSNYNNQQIQLTKQQSKLAGLQQEQDFKTNQVNDLVQQKEINVAQLKDAVAEIEASSTTLHTVEKELLDLMQNKEVEQVKLNEADQLYYNLRNALAEKETVLRHKQKQKEQIDQTLNEVKDKVNELKLQVTGTKERLYVEFKINIDDVLDQPRIGEMPVEELQEKADKMKKRLENLGEVNPTAIEAYEEMKKRYDFIVEQKNDLVSAKESLLQTIQEVEATANQKFLDTFNQVRENFKKVFKALFTDDDEADLILDNPDNLGETGIEVVAKPKGKRPTSLTQLSGGERTLTATALLFAIYLIKPAPFCILDEVDAPLDDANVGKFTQMIRKFSENSQFIIVTHNKTTMASVDVIYGVTMQEPGVSKLVPVDFRNLN
jgi:chromosome segregation protein